LTGANLDLGLNLAGIVWVFESGQRIMIYVFVGIVFAVLVALLVVLFLRASKFADEIEPLERRCSTLQSENGQLRAHLVQLDAEDTKKLGWLDGMEEELAWLRSELEKRPKLERKVYRILTVGVKATGKTSLTLKWSNPLVDLGTIEGTKIERYERSVSHVREKDKLIEQVFEVHDWGGEHIVDALQELMVEEVHGLLIVVDLGAQEAVEVDLERVSMQLDEFKPQSLRYFFSPKTVACCKSVVLFINKSDLIAGTPAQVEQKAREYYQPLIDGIQRYATQIDVKVFVGSANSGHSTHMLFSHFVERILPKNAYDSQLLQRMKTDWRPRPMLPSTQQQPLPSTHSTHSMHQTHPTQPVPHHRPVMGFTAPGSQAGRGTLPALVPAAAVMPRPEPSSEASDYGSTVPMANRHMIPQFRG
jgi:hypothetical protein